MVLRSVRNDGRGMDCFVAYAPLRKRLAFVAGNVGTIDARLHSRGATRPSDESLASRMIEGAGKAGAHRTRGLVCKIENTRVSHHR